MSAFGPKRTCPVIRLTSEYAYALDFGVTAGRDSPRRTARIEEILWQPKARRDDDRILSIPELG